MSATFYKVHFVKNHRHCVEGGFSERNAQFFALRMSDTPGVKGVEVISTNEMRPDIGQDIIENDIISNWSKKI